MTALGQSNRLPSIRNAVLTSVNAAGTGADYDRAPVAGASKFVGSEGVYWHEEEERVTGAGGMSILVHRSFVADVLFDVAWEQGDTVTVERIIPGQAVAQSTSGTVRAITITDGLAGIAPGVVRVWLDDA